MMAPTLGNCSRIRRAASRPSTPGIRMSSRTMSGWAFSTRVMASSPLDASPTTSMSSAMSRYRRRPCRTSEWSSAITTLMVTPCPLFVLIFSSVASILEVVGTPSQELQSPGENPRSEDVVPVHEQGGEQAQGGRGHAHHEVVGDQAALGQVGQGPMDGKQHGDEPGIGQEGPPL